MNVSLYIFDPFASKRSVLLQDETFQKIKFCKHPFLAGRGSRIRYNKLVWKKFDGVSIQRFLI